MIPTNTVARLRKLATLAVTLSCVAVLSFPPSALADPSNSSASLKAQAQAALASRNALHESLDRAAADYVTALQAEQDAQQKATDAQAHIDEANAQIEKLQSHLSERARSMYRTGSATMLDCFLGASTWPAVVNNWDILNDLNSNDTKDVQESKDLRAEVQNQKSIYDEQTRLAQQKSEEAKKIQEDAQAKEAEAQATYDSLNSEVAAALKEEEKAQEEAQTAQAHAAAENRSHNNSPNIQPDNSSGGSAPAYDAARAQAIVQRAQSCEGTPYKIGAVGPTNYDCSGLVSYAILGAHARLGSTYTFITWPKVSNPQPGDICTSSYHCGIYIGGGMMIHAPHDGDVVRVGPVQGDMIYVRHY